MMLLRVDKVAGGNAPSHPLPSSDPPLHACLGTAPVDGAGGSPASGSGAEPPGSTHQGGSATQGGASGVVSQNSADGGASNSGEILTVGRKNCTATIDDKCVSRSHASIALLSNAPLDDDAKALASDLLGRDVMEFGSPSTPAEIQACETSLTGVICVVRDKGSKFGTYVSVDEELLRAHRTNDAPAAAVAAGGGDETGDETDDEGAAGGKGITFHALTEKQSRAVELLSGNNDNDGGNDAKFVKLDPHQSFPLLQLSHSTTTTSPHVIILFGPQGSALRLSLLSLCFTFSRVKKPALDPILASLHYIGALHSPQWDVHKSTHLVAPDKTAAAKGIMAWASRRPVVTTSYIEALLARRTASEALPDEGEYTPPGTWDRTLRWTEAPSMALRGYRVAVLVDDDNGPLAASAGADVLALYEHAPTNHAEFTAWWAAQTAKAAEEKMALVVVGSTSKKCKQLHDWLKHDEGVRFTNAKNLAKAITGNDGAGELLLDAKKAVVEKIEGWDAVVGGAKESKEEGAKGAADASSKAASASEAAPEAEVAAEPVAEEMEEVDFTNAGNDDVVDEPEEEAPAKRKSPKRKGRRDEGPEEEHEEDRPDRQKRRRRNEEGDAEAEEASRAREVPAAEAEAAADKSTTKKSNQTSQRPRKEEAESSDDEPGLPEERIPLPKTDDGWLVAAPKRRRAYRKEIVDAEETVPEAAAESEKVSGLVVRAYVPPDRTGGATSTARRAGGGARGKKKDFKRFRKNHVLRGYTSFDPRGGNRQMSSVPTIRLVERMPKESERQRQLQQEQQRLERDQELADQLFNDGGAKSGRKRGGGGMMAYLSQGTAAKRGRGRR